MANCTILGRGKARYSKKLEKVKEKITKLKVSMLQKYIQNCNSSWTKYIQNKKAIEMMSQELEIKSKQLEDVQRHRDE